MNWPILSLIVWLPVIAGTVLLFVAESRAALGRTIALLASLAALLLTAIAIAAFDLGTAAMQFEERVVWIEAFSIHYHLGVDGLSLPLIALTA
ncbi:MAG: NADH-quinone oxidoreductase subunit M, partial [Wenzhouxiangellaceae bacterium]